MRYPYLFRRVKVKVKACLNDPIHLCMSSYSRHMRDSGRPTGFDQNELWRECAEAFTKSPAEEYEVAARNKIM
jgi:hypothetical protein